ncbi:hypothetical protein [Chryseobacterium sp. Mn2064]|uniref:hypothetical protein n=1 Tax=Chryseobacterium sp. Mn2064 TaxID=3395263 RepID=UPI003BBBEEB8
MKKLLYAFLVFASGMLFAQKSNTVKFAVYKDVIGTVKMFDNHKSDIEKLNVYKTKAALPSNLKKFEYLADNGLTEVKLKKNAGNPDSISLELLNSQGNVPKNSPIFVEGYKIEGPKTRIYSEMIDNIEVIDFNGQKCLSISTIQK